MNIMGIIRSIGRAFGIEQGAGSRENSPRIVQEKTARELALATRFISAETPRELAHIFASVKEGNGVRAGTFTVKDPKHAQKQAKQVGKDTYGPELVVVSNAWMAVMEGAKKMGYGLTPELIALSEKTITSGMDYHHSGGSHHMACQYIQRVWIHGDHFYSKADACSPTVTLAVR